MMGTRISVITPSYNYGRYIDDTLNSVHYQDVHAWEHLVLDDGSSDDSVARVRSHPGGASIAVQQNAGLAATLNRLVEAASGDWIGWLNADDFYLADTLATVTGLIERDPTLDVLIGDSVFVDRHARTLRLLPSHACTRGSILHYGMSAKPCAFFVRASRLRSIGFNEETEFLMDKWLFAELVQSGAKSMYVPVPLGAMRRHGEQVSTKLKGSSGDQERKAFRQAFDLPWKGVALSLSRWYGRGLHVALKLTSGGYWRELKWRSAAGGNLRWWPMLDLDS